MAGAAATTVHDLAGHLPYLHLAEGVDLPTYFVVTSLAFIAALLFLLRRAEARDLPRSLAIDSAIALMLGAFVGARLFHVFFEEPTYYVENPSRVFEFWRGGFVWYGGVIGGALAGLALLKWKHAALTVWLDLYAPVVALGYGLGRVACLLTGCCFGEVCELGDYGLWRHPTQAYASLSEFLVLFILLRIEKRRREPDVPRWLRPPGQVFLIWLALHGCGRIFMETFRDDPRGPLVFGLSVATVISLGAVLMAPILLAIRTPAPGKRPSQKPTKSA